MATTKTCFKCGTEKPPSDFYVHPKMTDGCLNKCKDCTISDAQEYRLKNLARVQAYDRGRGNRQSIGYLQKYRKENPRKNSAHNTVNNAVRDGRIEKQPCKVCGSEENIHGHHDDYGKPLDVIWLCATHHGERHREINEMLRKTGTLRSKRHKSRLINSMIKHKPRLIKQERKL